MIKLEHVVLPSPEQMEFVIEGMRNPMNSWSKSDSIVGSRRACEIDDFFLGDDDLDLMRRLSSAGTDHRKFMRMMPVMVRITAPLYWWKEFDTYKVGTVANSCSTMHKITEKEFTLEDFSCERLIPGSIEILEDIINILNEFRELYLKYDYMNHEDHKHFDESISCKKDLWHQLIQLLPSSYNQTRNVMLNYEVLANIYPSRKNHKLDEWQEFCKWIETLPYHELITGPDILSLEKR